MTTPTYRVMGRSGPIARGLTLADANRLAAASGCEIALDYGEPLERERDVRIALTFLELCPSCRAGDVDVGSCRRCDGAGVLDAYGQPFHAPPPFDTWTAAQLVALSDNSRRMKGEPAPMTTPDETASSSSQPRRRLTQSEIIERLTGDRSPSRSKVELDWKKSPGDSGPRTTWHIEVVAGADEDEVRAAYRLARELHEDLLDEYAPDEAPAS